MITKHVVRIADPVYRAPLWTLWFPFAVLGAVVDAIAEGHGRDLFTRRYWRFTATIYTLGRDGVFAHAPL